MGTCCQTEDVIRKNLDSTDCGQEKDITYKHSYAFSILAPFRPFTPLAWPLERQCSYWSGRLLWLSDLLLNHES